MVRPDPFRRRAVPAAAAAGPSAYAKLEVVLSGDQERIAALGPLERSNVPGTRPAAVEPCDAPSCGDWLDDVAAWVNHEYGWGVERLIPPCWPRHPHIAHELAVLADQRYTAGQAFHGGALEEWHRYSLPHVSRADDRPAGEPVRQPARRVARRRPVPRLQLAAGHL